MITEPSAQALPAPLPLGWTPLYALEIGPVEVAPHQPLELAILGVAASALSEDPPRALVVRWDDKVRRWYRLAGEPQGADRIGILLHALGTVAVVAPDTHPVPTPIPEEGTTLEGVAPVAVPALSSAGCRWRTSRVSRRETVAKFRCR